MAQAAKANKARLGTLLLALVGCVVVAVPMVYSLVEPLPMTLIGCGVSTIALAGFLFFPRKKGQMTVFMILGLLVVLRRCHSMRPSPGSIEVPQVHDARQHEVVNPEFAPVQIGVNGPSPGDHVKLRVHMR